MQPPYSPSSPNDISQSHLYDSDSDTTLSHCSSFQPEIAPSPKTPVEELPSSDSVASPPLVDAIAVAETLANPLLAAGNVSASLTILQIPSPSLSSLETYQDSQHSPTTLHPAEDALKFFQPKDLRVEALSSSALKAFAIIEPWLAAQKCSAHPLITGVVNAVVGHAKSYRSAIRKSLKTANDGISLAEDAITLCDILFKAEDSSKDIAAFVDSMIGIATAAHIRAEATSNQFRDIRSGLLQLCKKIPDIVTQLENEQSAGNGLRTDVVILPAPLSQNILVDDPEQMQQKFQDCAREKEGKTISDIEIQLNRVREDIGQLITHTGNFVDWWYELIINLNSLKTVISTMKATVSNPLRLKDINKKWIALRQQYIWYSRRMTLIEDSFAPPSNKSAKKDLVKTTHVFRLRQRLKKFIGHGIVARFLGHDHDVEERSAMGSEVSLNQYPAVI